MTLAALPLSYCTNVHPGRTLAEVEQGLDRYTVHVRQNLAGPLAAGLWLARPVVSELLAAPAVLAGFVERLRRRDVDCYTLNAFPYGDFHSERVKEKVYIPDWTTAERLRYTLECAGVLAAILSPDAEGSISTVPLGFKDLIKREDFVERCIDRLIELARSLDTLRTETGRLIRLAIEPEPLCVLETTDETLRFFERLRERAAEVGAGALVATHLGVCYDVCHQAVEFEDVEASIAALAAAQVRINKVHITCAIELADPGHSAAAREALARYAEPRYLHQTFARTASGEVLRALDLTAELARTPHDRFRDARMWRIHFHVPVDAERLGPLSTTRSELRRALAAVAKLDYAPHLEVETYTWEVLPGGDRVDLVEGLTRELAATRELLDEIVQSVH
ncbi:MAG: metabolite traffic protein EboE [Planctomycetes bacterium]|nr:metabolite traffic protein EboE [Planctomycetota bacterium]